MADWFDSLEELLKDKSREDLVVLIQELVKRHREAESTLELLVKVPLGGATGSQTNTTRGKLTPTVDAASLRRKAASAFYGAERAGWGAEIAIANELEGLRSMGDKFAQAGQLEDARIVYTIVAQEAIAHYEETHDEGEISTVIADCAAGLVEYLQASFPSPGAARQEVLKTLYELWKFEQDYGGVEEDLAEVIIVQVSENESERRLVESWIRQEMRPGQDYSSKWHNRRLVGFLAKLKQPDNFSTEDLLLEYQRAKLYKELALKLLELNRTDEALKAANENLVEAAEVTEFADKLLAAGENYSDTALNFIEGKLKAVEKEPGGKKFDTERITKISTYQRWLGEKYAKHGNSEKALAIELALFRSAPREDTYQRVKVAAQLPDQPPEKWVELRSYLITLLEQHNNWEALINLYLKEEEVSQAIEAVSAMDNYKKASSFGYSYSQSPVSIQFDLKVAQAAEQDYPVEAIRLYQRAAEKQIAMRGRDNYQEAVSYLGKARAIYLKQNRQADWEQYISQLRNSNKALRALKEELDKKGL